MSRTASQLRTKRADSIACTSTPHPRCDPPRARTAQADLHLEGGRPCDGQRLRWPVSQPCS